MRVHSALRPAMHVFAAVALFALAACSFAQSSTRADAEKDVVLRAMLRELERNQKNLHLKDGPLPYFIEFRVEDTTEYRANASYGALTDAHDSHLRLARVRVHVGDYKLDNSHVKPSGQFASLLLRAGLGGDGAAVTEVVDDDPVALRYGLWSAADTAYKRAIDDLTKRQTELKSVETPPEVDDFSREKPIIHLEPAQSLVFDREGWTKIIEDGSGLIFNEAKAKPFAEEIQESTGMVEARVRTEYLVNTEGSIVRKSSSEYLAETDFSAQATDGMRLERSYPLRANNAAGLGAAGVSAGQRFHDGSLRALTGLDTLCKAPVFAEEYHGPVLLNGNAAAHAFETLLARAVEARPPAAGSSARVTGAFASSYHSRVLPDFINVVDDPTLTTFSGKPVVGGYAVDDEGVPAQKVTLVDGGKLVGYVLGREPVRDFPSSNGHGRASIREAPVSKIGVLEIQAPNGISEDDLMKKLIEMGKDQGLPYVYLIQTLSGMRARTMEKINVATGAHEIVRGGQLADFDLHTLRTGILAAGSQSFVSNEFGDVPTTVIAPSVLLEDVTVKRASEQNAKLPYIPVPSE